MTKHTTKDSKTPKNANKSVEKPAKVSKIVESPEKIGAGATVQPINKRLSFKNFQAALAMLDADGLTVIVDHKIVVVPKR